MDSLCLICIPAGVFALIFFCVLRKRKQKRKEKWKSSSKSVALNKIKPEDWEFPLVDFKSIANATYNFSQDNQLGEGGFGPVYKYRSGDQVYEQASQVANDAVGSIRTVASFCAEEKVMDMYQKKCNGPMKSGIRLGIVSGVSLGVGSSALFLVNSFIFYIGSVLEKHGKAIFAEIFRVFFALTMTAIGVSQTLGLAPDIAKVKNSAASIFEILDSKPKIDSSDDEGSTIDTLKVNIELQNFSFKYPTRPNIPIFVDLCLSIPSRKARVTIQNFYQYHLVGKPGWKIGWTWENGEVIQSMSGVFATYQGNCTAFKYQQPHCCMKTPSIVNIMPEATFRSLFGN